MVEWKSHGAPVPGEAEIKYDRFIVIRATPGTTSGCSIDSMNHGVDEILAKNGGELLANNFIYYRNDAGALDYVDFREVKASIESGAMHAGTIIFDSTLGQANDLERWEVKLADSWLARFMPKASKA